MVATSTPTRRWFLALVTFLMAQFVALGVFASPYAYIPNRGSDTVSVVDTATNQLLVTVPVGDEPVSTAATSDGLRLYVGNTQSNTVSVIDTSTMTVVKSIPVGITPWGMAMCTAKGKLFVVNANSRNVSVIDIISNEVVATIPVGINPENVAVNPSGSRAYVANYGAGTGYPSTVSVIDTATNGVVATISIAPSSSYDAYNLVVNDTGMLVYVIGSGKIRVVDASTNTMVDAFQFSEGDHGGVAFVGATSRLYLTNHNSTLVSVIDTSSKKVIGTIAAEGNPEGIAANAEGTTLYVANYGSNSVSVIDTATSQVVSTIPVGLQPGACSISIAPGSFIPPPEGTSVPVLNGWWLLPGILSGLVLLRRRK